MPLPLYKDIKKSLYRIGPLGSQGLEAAKAPVRWRPALFESGLVLFAEAVLDQGYQGLDGGFGLFPLGVDLDRVTLTCGQHHQPHDRRPADRLPLAADAYIGGEGAGAAHELRRGAGVKPFFVGDGDPRRRSRFLPFSTILPRVLVADI